MNQAIVFDRSVFGEVDIPSIVQDKPVYSHKEMIKSVTGKIIKDIRSELEKHNLPPIKKRMSMEQTYNLAQEMIEAGHLQRYNQDQWRMSQIDFLSLFITGQGTALKYFGESELEQKFKEQCDTTSQFKSFIPRYFIAKHKKEYYHSDHLLEKKYNEKLDELVDRGLSKETRGRLMNMMKGIAKRNVPHHQIKGQYTGANVVSAAYTAPEENVIIYSNSSDSVALVCMIDEVLNPQNEVYVWEMQTDIKRGKR